MCPIEKKDGTGTYWMRLGIAYAKQGRVDQRLPRTLPMNGKIQLREWTEEELRERDQRRSPVRRPSLATLEPTSRAVRLASAEPLPF